MLFEQLWEIFVAFFISNILGYGGGPASIPLIYDEVVTHYNIVTPQQFSNALAIGNALPGPIATKLAAVIGYSGAGVIGALVALFATVFPSIIALMILVKLVAKYKESEGVRGITLFVQPVIAMLMLVLTWNMSQNSAIDIGWLQTIIIALFAFIAMQRWKWHPAIVIVIAFAYGGIILPFIT